MIVSSLRRISTRDRHTGTRGRDRVKSQNVEAEWRYALFTEPAVLATEPTGSLAWASRHKKERENSDDKCKKALDIS